MAKTEDRDGILYVIEPEGEWPLGPVPTSQPVQKPDTDTLLGQFVVQQILKNAELEQAINTIGQGIVQLMLKGSV